MASYVVLGNFTDQGIKTVKDSPTRAEAFKKVCEGVGARLVGVQWTIGAYDLVAMLEGTEEAVTAALLKLGSAGNVRSQTLRAYSADEFKAILRNV